MNTSCEDYSIQKNSWLKLSSLYESANIDVCKALWRHETVCVKHIKFGESKNISKSDVENEVKILSKCIHPKICQFLGADINDKDVYMVFEFMEHGDLGKYMTCTSIEQLRRMEIMTDIAKGLCYLHNRKPDIIMHRDLKPENILIGAHGVAKIADFGISKLVKVDDTKLYQGHTGERGTYTWMSPEVLKHEKYNIKSDIYSFGLLMYYIWTSKRPFSQYKMNRVQLMLAKFKNEAHLEPFESNGPLFDLVTRCVQMDPELRPDIGQVITELRWIHQTLADREEARNLA